LVCCALALVLGRGAAAYAQTTDFTQAAIHLGDTIVVVKVDGTEVRGHVTGLTAQQITIGGYQFTAEPGLKIERDGDPLWNGIGIGGSIGFLLGALICGSDEGLACGAGSGVAYGLFGALLDWAHVGRTLIYRVPPAPVALRISPADHGVALSIGLSWRSRN
jgi:hypothetical protein